MLILKQKESDFLKIVLRVSNLQKTKKTKKVCKNLLFGGFGSIIEIVGVPTFYN